MPWFVEMTNTVLLYNITDKKVMTYDLNDFVVPYNYRSFVRKDNQAYLVGGLDTNTNEFSNKVFLFDRNKSVMKKKSSMKNGRIGHAIFYSLDDEAYVIGGTTTQNKRLQSVEK